MEASYRILQWADIPLPVELKKDGSAEVEFPGFVDSDFNQAGVIHLWKVCSVLEAGRWVAMYRLNFANLVSNLGRDRTMFSRQVDYKISPELYSLTSRGKSCPYKVTTRPLYSGKTSFAVEQILYRARDNVELVTIKLSYVWVNSITRKPALLPEDVQQHFNKADVTNEGRYKHPGIPAKSFVYDIEVQPSDIDRNNHTNQARYVRFCSDTAQMAMSSGYYKGIFESITTLQLKGMVVEYVKESLNGHRLKVHTWQDMASPELVYFTIKRDEEEIFNCLWRLRQQPSSKL